MKFYKLWIPRRVVFVIPLLVIAIIVNIGITSCASYHVQSERNATEAQNALKDYLSLVFTKSRELEEVIYSDILNNLRGLARIQNAETESKNEDKKPESTKPEKIECENRKKSKSLDNPPFQDVFLTVGEGQNRDKLIFRNVTAGGPEKFPKDGYLLGYSGNPFGSRKLIAGVKESLGNDQSERAIMDPRKKRSVLHLYNMVLCSTGCNPLSYKGYGCYCGFLGSGFVVDGIDSCCKMHDWCYNSAGCPMFLEYFIPYLWKCYHRQPLCAIDHGYYSGPGSCSQRLCECDRQLALCLRRHPCPSTKALCTSSPWRLLQNILML